MTIFPKNFVLEPQQPRKHYQERKAKTGLPGRDSQGRTAGRVRIGQSRKGLPVLRIRIRIRAFFAESESEIFVPDSDSDSDADPGPDTVN